MDDPKIKAFGQWLTLQTERYHGELLAICANDKLELASVKRKFGHFEAYQQILNAFTDMYNNSLDKFEKEYLDKKENEDDS
jgi:hypothetical protein